MMFKRLEKNTIYCRRLARGCSGFKNLSLGFSQALVSTNSIKKASMIQRAWYGTTNTNMRWV